MSLTLFYDGGVVFLRSPELGDIRRLDTYVDNRETVGGELKSVKDSSWPDKQVRAFVIRAISPSIAADFRDALEASAGQLVTITDHNSENWEGVIISNPNDIITQRDDCYFDISFEMMCEYIGVPTLVENDDNDQVYNDDEEPVKAL